MVFFQNNVGDGICMPLESGMTGALGTFSQAANVIRGDKTKTRYGRWVQLYYLGQAFTIMPLRTLSVFVGYRWSSRAPKVGWQLQDGASRSTHAGSCDQCKQMALMVQRGNIVRRTWT